MVAAVVFGTGACCPAARAGSDFAIDGGEFSREDGALVAKPVLNFSAPEKAGVSEELHVAVAAASASASFGFVRFNGPAPSVAVGVDDCPRIEVDCCCTGKNVAEEVVVGSTCEVVVEEADDGFDCDFE